MFCHAFLLFQTSMFCNTFNCFEPLFTYNIAYDINVLAIQLPFKSRQLEAVRNVACKSHTTDNNTACCILKRFVHKAHYSLETLVIQ